MPGYRFVCMLKQDVEQEGTALDDWFVVDDIHGVGWMRVSVTCGHIGYVRVNQP